MPDVVLPPWADSGTFALPIVDAPTFANAGYTCGSARYVATGFVDDSHHVCIQGEYLYDSFAGVAVRWNLTQPSFQNLLGGADGGLGGAFACRSDALMAAISDRASRYDAVVEFASIDQPGLVRWERYFPAPQIAAAAGGIVSIATSDELTAWIYRVPDAGYHLMVAGPNGDNPRELPLLRYPYHLQADGPHLTYIDHGDVWLWTVGSDTAENLTQDEADQWFPWISGNRMVWVDQRDTPGGWIESPLNPEIYTFDLTTRVRTRLTFDPPDRPAIQHAPVLVGDWAVWMDFRDADVPNPPQYFTDTMEIWGYNFVTNQQYPLLTGHGLRASFPTMRDGNVYFRCTQPDQSTQIFTLPLPAVPTP